MAARVTASAPGRHGKRGACALGLDLEGVEGLFALPDVSVDRPGRCFQLS